MFDYHRLIFFADFCYIEKILEKEGKNCSRIFSSLKRIKSSNLYAMEGLNIHYSMYSRNKTSG